MADIYRRTDKPNAARDVLRDAVRECDRALKKNDTTGDTAGIYFRKANLYQAIGDPLARQDTLQYIVDHYHDTPYAEQAQRMLKRM